MGTLFVVATPIGNLGDMTPRAIEVLQAVDLIAAEDTRHTGNLLRLFEIATPTARYHRDHPAARRRLFGIAPPTVSYHRHNQAARADQLLEALQSGDVALVSDAGTPA